MSEPTTVSGDLSKVFRARTAMAGINKFTGKGLISHELGQDLKVLPNGDITEGRKSLGHGIKV